MSENPGRVVMVIDRNRPGRRAEDDHRLSYTPGTGPRFALDPVEPDTASAEATEGVEQVEDVESRAEGEAPVRIVMDSDKHLRFPDRAEQERALPHREEISADLRPKMISAGYNEEYLDQLLEILFTGRTADEPPKVPTNVRMYGRMSDDISEDEKGETHSAYDEHMEQHWGF